MKSGAISHLAITALFVAVPQVAHSEGGNGPDIQADARADRDRASAAEARYQRDYERWAEARTRFHDWDRQRRENEQKLNGQWPGASKIDAVLAMERLLANPVENPGPAPRDPRLANGGGDRSSGRDDYAGAKAVMSDAVDKLSRINDANSHN